MAKKIKLRLIGLDEVGRGPLAGPVVAVALKVTNYKKIQNSKFRIKNYSSLDSKKLSPRKREEIYEIITKSPFVEYGVGVVSEKIIDKVNILEATKLAMKKATERIDCTNARLIIDGNFTIDSQCVQKAVKRADETVLECSLASIIAKVERDGMMVDYHKKYPYYEFDKHKGYGTKKHREMIKKYGCCPIHRKSFKLL